MRLSARNRLPGTVSEINQGAVTTTVKELGLAPGVSVTVIVKASDVILATE